MAVDGEVPTTRQVAEHFADKSFWGTMVIGEGANKRAVWVWLGPNVPPYELARHALKETR